MDLADLKVHGAGQRLTLVRQRGQLRQDNLFPERQEQLAAGADRWMKLGNLILQVTPQQVPKLIQIEEQPWI